MTAPAQPPADGQYSEEWLKTAAPGHVEIALKAGKLQHLLTGENPPDIPAEGQLNDVHLQQMTPEQIADAYEAGRFGTLLYAPPKG